MSHPSIDCFLAQIVKLGNLVAAEPRYAGRFQNDKEKRRRLPKKQLLEKERGKETVFEVALAKFLEVAPDFVLFPSAYSSTKSE